MGPQWGRLCAGLLDSMLSVQRQPLWVHSEGAVVGLTMLLPGRTSSWEEKLHIDQRRRRTIGNPLITCASFSPCIWQQKHLQKNICRFTSVFQTSHNYLLWPTPIWYQRWKEIPINVAVSIREVTQHSPQFHTGTGWQSVSITVEGCG